MLKFDFVEFKIQQLKQVCTQGKADLTRTLVPLKLHGFLTKIQNEFFKKL